MKHSDFSIGLEFKTGSGLWRCTDIGTRTILAIKITDDNIVSYPDNLLRGPPYIYTEEIVFDEYDFGGCSK